MKKIAGLFVVAIMAVFFMTAQSDAAPKPKKPKFVGALKCDSSCHDPFYKAWKTTPHAKAFELLKPGVRADRKKLAKLNPDEDYTSNPLCVRCHTTGFQQAGGYKIGDGPDSPEEPNLAAIGCEMCHSVMGGAMFRVTMKEKKEKFLRTETEKEGQRFDYENVCKRCHEHENTPFKPSLDAKYKFVFAERMKKVHEAEKFYDADNKEQKITKKDGKSVHGVGDTDKSPLPIEQWEVKGDKLVKKVWPSFDKGKITFGGGGGGGDDKD